MEKWSYFFDLSPFLLIKLDLIRKKNTESGFFSKQKNMPLQIFCMVLPMMRDFQKRFVPIFSGGGNATFARS